MANTAVVLLSLFCATVHARQRLHSGDRIVTGVITHAQFGQETQQTWWDPQTPEMDAAYAHARRNTQPELVNATDYKYFKELYGTDKDNALEHLALTSPATQPSQEQVAAQSARERAEMDKIMPKVHAEEKEAESYYHNVFPYDTDNPLEEFTYSNNSRIIVANASSAASSAKKNASAASAMVKDGKKVVKSQNMSKSAGDLGKNDGAAQISDKDATKNETLL